jgi:hypothetical protein
VRKKSLLALLAIASLAAAVVVGLGASAALAGESTGNCGAATDPADLAFKGSDTAAANCKGPVAEDGTRVSNGNSWCSYSGQNDHPEGTPEEGPGGRTQNWGQTSQPGSAIDPSQLKGGNPSPGTACNKNKPGAGPLPTETPPRK